MGGVFCDFDKKCKKSIFLSPNPDRVALKQSNADLIDSVWGVIILKLK